MIEDGLTPPLQSPSLVINICAATVFFFALFKWQGHDSAIVTLWFYGVGAGFLLLHFLYSGDSGLMRRTDWEKWVFYSLTLTVIFATSIYTRIKPYWGGGMIPSITIHFMKSTSFAATIDATGFLIDETDKGFYIAHKANDNSATFVSREQVASIEFVAVK